MQRVREMTSTYYQPVTSSVLTLSGYTADAPLTATVGAPTPLSLYAAFKIGIGRKGYAISLATPSLTTTLQGTEILRLFLSGSQAFVQIADYKMQATVSVEINGKPQDVVATATQNIVKNLPPQNLPVSGITVYLATHGPDTSMNTECVQWVFPKSQKVAAAWSQHGAPPLNIASCQSNVPVWIPSSLRWEVAGGVLVVAAAGLWILGNIKKGGNAVLYRAVAALSLLAGGSSLAVGFYLGSK